MPAKLGEALSVGLSPRYFKVPLVAEVASAGAAGLAEAVGLLEALPEGVPAGEAVVQALKSKSAAKFRDFIKYLKN